MDFWKYSLFHGRLCELSSPDSLNYNSSSDKHQPIFLDNEPLKVHERLQKAKHHMDDNTNLEFRRVMRFSAIFGMGKFPLLARKRHVFYILWF